MNRYQYEADRWGPYEIHKVFDAAGQTGFSVAPGRGGCLVDLKIKGVSLLDGYREYAGLESLEWAKSAILAPFPNRLKDGRFEMDGRAYQFPLNDEEGGNALHGFVLDKPFEVVGIETLADRAAIALEYRYGGELPWFPFPFAISALYEISDAAGFSIDLRLTNTGPGVMPAGLGWHPYFQLGGGADDWQLRLPPVERVAVDERMIPTGEKMPFSDFEQPKLIGEARLDTCFRLLNPEAVSDVLLEGQGIRLRYWQDSRFPYLQVFIPPSRQTVALEPMTCNVDAFNNGEGLLMLSPGKSMGGRAGCDAEKLEG